MNVLKKLFLATLVGLAACGGGQMVAYPIKVTKLTNKTIEIFNIYDMHFPSNLLAEENEQRVIEFAKKEKAMLIVEDPNSWLLKRIMKMFSNQFLINLACYNIERIKRIDPRKDIFKQLPLINQTFPPLALSQTTMNNLYDPIKNLWDNYSGKHLTIAYLSNCYNTIIQSMEKNHFFYWLKQKDNWLLSNYLNSCFSWSTLREKTLQLFDLQVFVELEKAILEGQKKFIICSGAIHAENISTLLCSNGFTETVLGSYNGTAKEALDKMEAPDHSSLREMLVFIQKNKPLEEKLQNILPFTLTNDEIKTLERQELPSRIGKKAISIIIYAGIACLLTKKFCPSIWSKIAALSGKFWGMPYQWFTKNK